MSLLSRAFRTALVPTQPTTQLVSVIVSSGLKRSVLRDEHSPQSSEVKNAWTFIPLMYSCSVLKRQKDKLTSTILKAVRELQQLFS
jgi:hypothetical protein